MVSRIAFAIADLSNEISRLYGAESSTVRIMLEAPVFDAVASALASHYGIQGRLDKAFVVGDVRIIRIEVTDAARDDGVRGSVSP